MNTEQILLAITISVSGWTLLSIIEMRIMVGRICEALKQRGIMQVLALGTMLCLVGCSSKPTALEKWLFAVQTNAIAVTDKAAPAPPVPAIGSSIEAGSSPATNGGAGLAVTAPGIPTAPVYTFTPGAGAAQVQTIGEFIGGLFGYGGVVSTILTGILGVWARVRSNRAKNRAQQAAAVLAQTIETGRHLLKLLPEGNQLEAKWRAWMTKQQLDSGTINEVFSILRGAVDPLSAQAAARQLKDKIA